MATGSIAKIVTNLLDSQKASASFLWGGAFGTVTGITLLNMAIYELIVDPDINWLATFVSLQADGNIVVAFVFIFVMSIVAKGFEVVGRSFLDAPNDGLESSPENMAKHYEKVKFLGENYSGLLEDIAVISALCGQMFIAALSIVFSLPFWIFVICLNWREFTFTHYSLFLYLGLLIVTFAGVMRNAVKSRDKRDQIWRSALKIPEPNNGGGMSDGK